MANMRGILTAIKNLSVSYTPEAGGGAVTPTALDVHEIPLTEAPTNLPLRLVGEVAEAGLTLQMEYLTTGYGAQILHTITELFLLQAVGLSRKQDEVPDLVRYVDAFETKLRETRTLISSPQTIITGSSSVIGFSGFPSGSEEMFYSVVTRIAVLETV